MFFPSIKEWDEALFLIINSASHPFMDLFFTWITAPIFWTPLYIVLFFFVKKKLGWKGVVFLGLVILVIDQSTSFLLKPLFARYRPCYAPHLQAVHLVGDHIGIYGFPSSHASNTFVFATFFWKTFYKKYKYTYLFFPWATIISYGRIYGGMHYPLDVIFGALVGIGAGLVVCSVKVNMFGNRL